MGRSAECDQLDIDGEIVDWTCQVLSVVGEDWTEQRAASVCRPDFRSADGRTGTCFSCLDDGNCADGVCVDLGLGGHEDLRCAGSCDPADAGACGPGFRCEARTGRSGESADVCVPIAGTCGDCVDRDGDGHGVGACLGRDCDDADALRFVGNAEVCNGLDSNCDGTVDTGFSTAVGVDGTPVYASVAACGGCGRACPAATPQTAWACVESGADFACEPQCAAPWSSCGAPLSPDPADAPACVFNTRNDPEACGSGCLDCAAELGSSAVFCDNGVCRRTSCDTGFASCEDPDANLCETELATSLRHCGSCGNDCAQLPRVFRARCTSGDCEIRGCEAGWADCNGVVADGCEVDTTTSREHCGECDRPCVGAATCDDGTCSCPASQTYCPAHGGCLSTQNSMEHCGACGRACFAGQTCVNGVCRCPTGQQACGGRCVNTQSDRDHCGGCGNACGGFEECIDGNCIDGYLCPSEIPSQSVICGQDEECCSGFGNCRFSPVCVDPRAGCVGWC